MVDDNNLGLYPGYSQNDIPIYEVQNPNCKSFLNFSWKILEQGQW